MSTSDNTSTQERSTRQGLQVALDESLYNLTDEERAFFKQQTGIQDDDELKAHIVQVQAEAYKVGKLGMLTAIASEYHPFIHRFIHIRASDTSSSQSK
jgi:hypothetical protein